MHRCSFACIIIAFIIATAAFAQQEEKAAPREAEKLETEIEARPLLGDRRSVSETVHGVEDIAVALFFFGRISSSRHHT